MRGNRMFTRRPSEVVTAWVLLLLIACAAYPRAALSEPVPIWAVFTQENSELPNNTPGEVILGPDGALWAGTFDRGLARSS
jgi:hypothetical protein